ncbi:RNA polymerase sigma-70 factor [Dyadobacter luticola]|uniref:RNA polymerase sigma-70 factor n=1 Tax=Dyadobacter luticola TaxID=1979387 RepID=UPI00148650CC|nr:RNA polymerase sigma-70 factor [Dyadobacter luticola]
MRNYPKVPEADLLTLLAANNKLAFRQLYSTYYGRVHAYALKFLRSSELADDIVQDVFTSVWENRTKLGSVKCIQAYLFAVCKNKTLNVLARAAMETSIKEVISNDMQHFHRDVEDKFMKDDFEYFLNVAIRKLPPQRQLVFRLCKMDGKSYEEVACRMGISVGTVNDHIVKALRFLRNCLLQSCEISSNPPG